MDTNSPPEPADFVARANRLSRHDDEYKIDELRREALKQQKLVTGLTSLAFLFAFVASILLLILLGKVVF